VLFEAIRAEVEKIGPAEIRVSKSQIAFKRKRGFAWVWIPGQYLHGQAAPLVLSLALRRLDPSQRWKQVVEPYPGRFMHHLELNSADELDDEVRAFLREAWEGAG